VERLEPIETFGQAVLEGNAALFVGAGLSLDAERATVPQR